MDNGVIRNHISPTAIRKMELFYRQKENLYPLVTILGNPILYRDSIIYFKTELIKVIIKGQEVVISFNFFFFKSFVLY